MDIRVYDLPTRVFHGLFAVSFLVAFVIANFVDDDEVAFSYHMIAGLIMCFILLWRLIWGVCGSRHARFSDFSLSPVSLFSYLKGVLSGSTQKWQGHNPASSWAALIFMLLTAGLGFTGVAMTLGLYGEIMEELHELMANTFIFIVVLHIAGVAIHQINHRDSLAKSMISGIKTQLPESAHPVAAHIGAGVLALVLSLGVCVYLLNSFDANSRTLTVLGGQLPLTESEEYDSDHGEHYDSDD